MSSPISALSGMTDTSSDSASKATSGQSVANQDTFLKLLVAQLQNQNPLQPSDGMQFVSEMAQFSELEQVIGIRSDLTTLVQKVTGANGTDQSSGTGAT